jgi:diguanylate cyclase (GGDEF)-like protein
VSLLLLDIDHYKAYNDLYGHGQGDICLVQVGRALRLATRRLSAVVARYGGEEFAVLLPATDAALARGVAERIQTGIGSLALVHAASPTAPHITVSIGVATLRPPPDGLPDDLLASADAALYAAKRDGRNRIVIA